MNNEKKSSINIIFEKKTSLFVFLWPTIVTFACFIYLFTATQINFLYLILALVFVFFQPFLLFWGKKLVITDRKIYVFSRNKKIISWHLTKEFQFVTFEQNVLGKFFGYGTLVLVDVNKNMYQYHYMPNVFQVYEQIIMAYEAAMLKRNPEYEPIYQKQLVENQNLDTLEE